MTSKRISAWTLATALTAALAGHPALAQDAAQPEAAPAPATAPALPSVPVDPAQAVAPVAEAPATAAAAPAPSDATQAATAASTEVVENPYGLDALWKQGDFIAKGTLIIMGIMSMVTWYLLFTKLWEQARLFKQAQEARVLWEAKSLEEGVQKLSADSAFRGMVEDGLKALKHHDGRLTDQIDLQQWVNMTMQRGVDSVQSELQNGLAFLATVGSTAPFIGLFGTVWGIYHALIAIGIAGQASIDKVAGPVGEALIMTAIGLAVAVPAVLGYNWLVRRNKLVMEGVRRFAGDVHAYLLIGVRLEQRQ